MAKKATSKDAMMAQHLGVLCLAKLHLLGLFTAIALRTTPVHGQGTFQNLDFEAAGVSGYSPGSVPASNAIPGRTACLGGVPQNTVLYNNETLGEAAVSLQGTNGGVQPIQGQCFVLLQATF